MGRKSKTLFVIPPEAWEANDVGRSYYCFCLESALANIRQARALVDGTRQGTITSCRGLSSYS
jgi:hypothetical protein